MKLRRRGEGEVSESEVGPIVADPSTRDKIEKRIASVVSRDMSQGWFPIGIIEGRVSEGFCEVRCVHTEGATETIKTFINEKAKQSADDNDNIPF